MSAPVDVLAVLDYEIQMIPLSTEDFGPQREQDVRDLRDARAAVAELIEAAKKLHIVTAGTSQNVDANERAALASALARVKGGAA